MTENFKDKNVQNDPVGMTFKEKILADLALATKERQRQREEWLKEEVAEKQIEVEETIESPVDFAAEINEYELEADEQHLESRETVEDFKADLDKVLKAAGGQSVLESDMVNTGGFDLPVSDTPDYSGVEEVTPDALPDDEEVFETIVLPASELDRSVETFREASEESISLDEVDDIPEASLSRDNFKEHLESQFTFERVESLSNTGQFFNEAPVEDLEITAELEVPTSARGIRGFDWDDDVLEPETGLPTTEDLLIWKKDKGQSVSRPEYDEDDIEELGEDDMSRESRQRTNRLAAKISTIFISLLVLFILAGGFFTYRYVTNAIAPVDSSSKEFVQVEIPHGSGNKYIGQILQQSGVIKDARVFNYYTKFKNYSNFQSGYYNFQKSMSLDDIAKYLQEGGTAEPQKPVLGKISVPEGYSLKQIARAVALNSNTEDPADTTPFTADEFMAAVQDETFISEMVAKYPKLLASLPEASAVKYRLEGYLFPATYAYYEGTTVKEIISQMLAAMDSNLVPYYAKIASNGMTVNQVLSLASLVEKEGATDEDRAKIASVFYNRWNINMPLQSNIAILYAMDKLGDKTTLAEDAGIDTSINSPYNIYLNTGLMPGPVDSPGLSAIKATIEPASTKFLYFVADVTTGAVYYAEGYDEHSANVEKYVNSKLR